MPTAYGPFQPIGFSDDGSRLAFVRDGSRVTICQVARDRVCREIPDTYADRVDFSPDGRWMAWADDRVMLWDLVAWRLAWSSAPGSPGTSAVFLPDGRGLLTSDGEGIRRWTLESAPDSPSARLVPAAEDRLGPAREMAVDRGGAAAVVALPGEDRALLFPLGRGERVAFPHAHVTRVALSPDGRWLATSDDGTGVFGRPTRVWDAGSGRLVVELSASVAILDFSPDGRWLATGCGREFQLWEVGPWRPGATVPMSNRTAGAAALAFSPDGSALAVAQHSRTIQLVDPATGRLLATLESPNTWTIQGLRFSPDGRYLGVTRWGASIQLWDLALIGDRLAAMGLPWDIPQGGRARKPPGDAPTRR